MRSPCCGLGSADMCVCMYIYIYIYISFYSPGGMAWGWSNFGVEEEQRPFLLKDFVWDPKGWLLK